MTTTLMERQVGFTPDELEDRKLTVGASELAMLAGDSPYGTAYDLALRKMPEYQAPPMTDEQWLGHMLEPVAVSLWHRQATERGERILHIEKAQKVIHPREPRMSASVDFIATYDDFSQEIIEVKTTSRHALWLWEHPSLAETDGIPAHYAWQIHGQRECTGIERARLILFCDRELREFVIPQRSDRQAEGLRLVREFWALRDAGRMPPITGSVDAEAWLRARYPRPEREQPLQPTPEQDAVLTAWIEADRQAKAAEKSVKLQRPAAVEIMAPYAEAETSLGRITFRADKNGKRTLLPPRVG